MHKTSWKYKINVGHAKSLHYSCRWNMFLVLDQILVQNSKIKSLLQSILSLLSLLFKNLSCKKFH